MQRLIKSYGCYEPRVEVIPQELKCVLYRFSSAMCRRRRMKGAPAPAAAAAAASVIHV